MKNWNLTGEKHGGPSFRVCSGTEDLLNDVNGEMMRNHEEKFCEFRLNKLDLSKSSQNQTPKPTRYFWNSLKKHLCRHRPGNLAHPWPSYLATPTWKVMEFKSRVTVSALPCPGSCILNLMLRESSADQNQSKWTWRNTTEG